MSNWSAKKKWYVSCRCCSIFIVATYLCSPRLLGSWLTLTHFCQNIRDILRNKLYGTVLQLTNNLQRKLNEVRREKEVLEKHQMSKSELEARLAAMQKAPGGDFDMSEALEEKEDMEEDE